MTRKVLDFVLEFLPAQCAVVHCFATANMLDRLRTPEHAIGVRIAGNELVCVTRHTMASTLLAALSDSLEQLDSQCLVVDRSDTWSVLTLAGSDREKAFSRLCTTPLPSPPAFLQGAIGGVPAKAIILKECIHVMVSSVLRHHLRERILSGCKDLAPRELPPRVFDLGASREMA